MPLDVGRVSHLIEQMHRSEDDAGDPIVVGKVLVTDGSRGFTWEDAASSSLTPATTVTDETTLGISQAVGTDLEYARQDHTHGSPDADAVKDAGRWEHAVITGSPPDDLYADGDWLYIWVP